MKIDFMTKTNGEERNDMTGNCTGVIMAWIETISEDPNHILEGKMGKGIPLKETLIKTLKIYGDDFERTLRSWDYDEDEIKHLMKILR